MDHLMSINWFGCDDPKDLPKPEPFGPVNIVPLTAFSRAAGMDAFHSGLEACEKFARTVHHPVADEPEGLAKGETTVLEKSGNRKRAAVHAWVRSQLALGKTLGELVAHAERHDLEIANLIREVA